MNQDYFISLDNYHKQKQILLNNINKDLNKSFQSEAIMKISQALEELSKLVEGLHG